MRFDPPLLDMGPVLPYTPQGDSREVTVTNEGAFDVEIFSLDFDKVGTSQIPARTRTRPWKHKNDGRSPLPIQERDKKQRTYLMGAEKVSSVLHRHTCDGPMHPVDNKNHQR